MFTEKIFAITGTYHGAIIISLTEGDARRAFHLIFNGESIIFVKIRPAGLLAMI